MNIWIDDDGSHDLTKILKLFNDLVDTIPFVDGEGTYLIFVSKSVTIVGQGTYFLGIIYSGKKNMIDTCKCILMPRKHPLLFCYVPVVYMYVSFKIKRKLYLRKHSRLTENKLKLALLFYSLTLPS